MKNYIKYFFLGINLLMFSHSYYAQSVGGTTSRATSFCTTTNSGFVTLSGHNGNILTWQLSTNGGLNWINIGNTNINQTYFNLNQTTCYRAVVQDGGFPADTSTIVCIDVFPSSDAGILSGGGIFCGNSATGSLTLSGYAGSILNWEYSTDGGSTWTTIANTTDTEIIGSVTQNTLYQVIVQSGNCPIDTSNIDSVFITPQTVPGSINGPGGVCTGGNAGNLTLTGYTGSILGWIYSTDGGNTWVPISNTTANQPYSNLTIETWYKAIIQNGSCNLDSTNTEIITVDVAPVAGTVSGGGTFCGNTASGTLTLSGSSGNILNWEYSTDGGATWTPITNTTTTETYTSLTQTTIYQVILQNGGCPIATSTMDTVFVTPQTVAGTINGPGGVCTGGNSGNLTLTGYTGNILGWIYSTDGGNTWVPISNTTATLPYSNLATDTWYQAIVQNGNCNLDSTATEIITVDVAPVAGTLSGGGTFCGTIASGILTLSGSSGTILNWEYSTDGGATWTTIANTTTSETYTNLLQTTIYQVNLQNGGCTIATSNIDTVFVTPQTNAGILLSDTSICPLLNQFDLTLNGNVGAILNWQSSTDNGLTWNNIVNTTNTLTVNGLLLNTQYRVVVQSGNCNKDSTNIVTVTVFSVSPISAGNDTTISIAGSALLNGTGTGAPIWSPTSSLNNPNIFNPTATPIITTNYILNVTDGNGCISVDSVIITVDDTTSIPTNIIITNLFTPNGDGINDFWYIENISNSPDNEVFIYNTNGHLVYSKKNYINEWGGTYNGEPLPDGTYYYIVKINNPSKTVKGAIDILR